MRILYLLLAVIGFVLPMWEFAHFFAEYGFSAGEFVRQLFANRVSGGFAADLVVSSIVFWVLVARSGVRHRWLYIALNLLVGLSFAFPLFLFARATMRQSGDPLPPGVDFPDFKTAGDSSWPHRSSPQKPARSSPAKASSRITESHTGAVRPA